MANGKFANSVCVPFFSRPKRSVQESIKSVQDLLTKENDNGVRVPITTQFFVIEYHPTTLQQLLESRKVGEKEVYQFAGELFSCFKFLFDNRVVHRDVKLDNILVSASGSLILSDFGESVMVDDNHCCKCSCLRGGNQQFQAPEVLNQIKLGAGEINFSGQYSWEVGCLLFGIVFGRFPFEDYPQNYGRAPHIAVPDPVIVNSGLHSGFDRLMAKLLVNNSDFRISIEAAHKEFKSLKLEQI